MSGAVSWEVLLWVVGVVIAAGGVVAGFLFWVWRLVEGIKRDASVAVAKLEAEFGEQIAGLTAQLRERDTTAQLEKERAKLVEDGLRKELSDFRQHVGETYATKEGVTSGIGRVESAVKDIASQLRDSIGGLTGRIDRLLEGQAAAAAVAQPGRTRS